MLCNFIENTFWHGWSPVNLLHIFRTPFLKRTPLDSYLWYLDVNLAYFLAKSCLILLKLWYFCNSQRNNTWSMTDLADSSLTPSIFIFSCFCLPSNICNIYWIFPGLSILWLFLISVSNSSTFLGQIASLLQLIQ